MFFYKYNQTKRESLLKHTTYWQCWIDSSIKNDI